MFDNKKYKVITILTTKVVKIKEWAMLNRPINQDTEER